MENDNKKDTLADFAQIFESFGKAIGQIFDDPALKAKAGEFGKSAVEAANTLGDRFQDEDVKRKFREVGEAAQKFGKSVEESFRDTKNNDKR